MNEVAKIEVIASNERGVSENKWLKSHHSFSFGQYYNLKRLQFGTLRVFNDDIIDAGQGFGTHPHDNMEIVTIVLEGAIEHKDSMGNHGIIKAGEVQRMTAGKGVRHSEFNPSKTEKTHLFQVWVYPEKRDLQPSYQQQTLDKKLLKNKLHPIVSKKPVENALTIHQDATFYLGEFDANKTIPHKLVSKKHGDYLFVIDGEIQIGDKVLKKGDSAEISSADVFEMHTLTNSKLLLIEVALN